MIPEVDMDRLEAYIRKTKDLLRTVTFQDLVKAGALKIKHNTQGGQ